MAERSPSWIERWFVSPLFLSLSLSFSLFLSLSVSFSDYLPTYPPLYLCIHLSLSLSHCVSVCLSLYLSINLSIYLPIYLSTYLSIYLFICLSIYLPTYLSIYLPIYLSVYLSTYLSIYLSVYLFTYLSICLSIYLPIYLSIYLSLYLSIYQSSCLSTYLSIYLPTYLSIYLSIDLPIYLSTYLSTYLSIYLPIYLSIYLSIYRFIYLSHLISSHLISSVYLTMYLSTYLSTYLPIYLPTYLSICLSVCLSIYLSICKLENEAILRDALRFWTWQHTKRSNSARRPQYLNLTASKTKQFCETSSCFKIDNIKNEAILRDFLQKWKVACSADGLVPMRFAICPIHLSKRLRLPRKKDARSRSYEVLHLSRKIISANLKIWCSKMQPLSGNQRPDLLTALMNMSLVLRLPRKMHLCRSSSNVPRLPSFFGNATTPSRFAHFWQGPQSLAPATRNDIWTSKSGPNPWCFSHVNFKMCLAPQRRALFRHLNFQKWSERQVFLPFSLANVLRATTACTFSTSQLPKGVRTWGLRIKKNIIGIKKMSPEKPIPSSTIECTTFSTIAHQFLSSLTQMLIPMRRSPGCYCTYAGLSALMCGCMHVRTCACMSV